MALNANYIPLLKFVHLMTTLRDCWHDYDNDKLEVVQLCPLNKSSGGYMTMLSYKEYITRLCRSMTCFSLPKSHTIKFENSSEIGCNFQAAFNSAFNQ